jgi:small subunit ribosomal protein S17
MEQQKKKRKVRCEVVSDKMEKSRVGSFVSIVKHPIVGKYIKRTSKVMFHDELNESKMGDTVLLEECRPMSAKKSFRLLSVVNKD